MPSITSRNSPGPTVPAKTFCSWMRRPSSRRSVWLSIIWAVRCTAGMKTALCERSATATHGRDGAVVRTSVRAVEAPRTHDGRAHGRTPSTIANGHRAEAGSRTAQPPSESEVILDAAEHGGKLVLDGVSRRDE